MFVKRNLLNAAVLGALTLAAGSAQAVYLGEDGTGEALIYPYYTVRDGYFTTMSVVNTTGSAKAVKVRFLEGKNSREVLDFNLYLSPYDVWTGWIEQTDSGARVGSDDASCTVPLLSTKIGGPGYADFRNFEYTGSKADGEDGSLNRTREGYIEVLEMGELNSATISKSTSGTITVTNAVTHSNGVPADCGAMVKGWATGGQFVTNANDFVEPPAGGLFGGASLIRTETGTDYSYDAVALDAWSDADLHFRPGTTSPSLADVSPKVSIVFNNGAAVSSNWSSLIAVDPVSAVLMRSAVMNEYTVESAVNAGTDWVVTFPTKRLYVGIDTGTNPDTNERWFERPFSDDFYTGGACEQVGLYYYGREEEHPIGDVDFSPEPPSGKSALCWEVNVVTFNGTSIMGSELAANQNVNTPYQYGWMNMTFGTGADAALHAQDGFIDTGATNDEATRTMVSNDSDTYIGLPVIGLMLQEFVRGDGSLDNYGGQFVHKYQRSITVGN